MLSDGIPARNAVAKKPRIVLAKRQLRKRHIETDLRSRGVCPASRDWTVYALKRLQLSPSNQYEAFLNFVGELNMYARNKFTIDQNEKIAIRIPWHGDLNRIDFDKLQKNELAMQEIRRRCVLPEGRLEFDLRELSWYNKSFK